MMISVEEALSSVRENIHPSAKVKTSKLADALFSVLAEDIIAPIHMPPFRQSAMDGYALQLTNSNEYNLVDEVKAGDPHDPVLKKGEAVRIFTGARVPETSDAIVIQENVRLESGKVILNTAVSPNDNIRPKGEQVAKGSIALKIGTPLNAAAIGFLASLGITEVVTYEKPSIAIVVTGNELTEPGLPLEPGKIYQSNGVMLTSQLRKLGYNQIANHQVADNFDKTVSVLNALIEVHDLVIISGGISVGDHDYVAGALKKIGVKELFYKVNQKPGKPLFFGRKDDTMIFALPGNPAATLSCFNMYVLLALEIYSGNTGFSLIRTRARSRSILRRKAGRPQFLKAIYRDGTVEILEGQNSSMLQTFALSNAFVFVPESVENIEINDEVEIILLP